MPYYIPELIAPLVMACLCGGALGLHRALNGKPAGTRVHGLVALACCTLVLSAHALTGADNITHIVQGIVTGIGFLGAGIIVRRAQSDGPDLIHHLSTATTVWLSSALGVACGFRQYALAIAATVLALIILVVFLRIDQYFFGHSSNHDDKPDPLS